MQPPDSDQFTDREKDIIWGVLAGKENVEIAANLEVSPHVVRNDLYTIFRTLGIHNRTTLALMARDAGWIGAI